MKRVLIIDDEFLVRDALQRVLQTAMTTVEVAPDAETALVVLGKQVFDLVIVGSIMPDVEGVQLIQRLRFDYPKVRVIAMSGGGNIELSGYRPDAVSTRTYLAAASNVGADGVLAKRFEAAELEALVQPLLDVSAQRPQIRLTTVPGARCSV